MLNKKNHAYPDYTELNKNFQYCAPEIAKIFKIKYPIFILPFDITEEKSSSKNRSYRFIVKEKMSAHKEKELARVTVDKISYGYEDKPVAHNIYLNGEAADLFYKYKQSQELTFALICNYLQIKNFRLREVPKNKKDNIIDNNIFSKKETCEKINYCFIEFDVNLDACKKLIDSYKR